jgi:hypothetical protein
MWGLDVHIYGVRVYAAQVCCFYVHIRCVCGGMVCICAYTVRARH